MFVNKNLHLLTFAKFYTVYFNPAFCSFLLSFHYGPRKMNQKRTRSGTRGRPVNKIQCFLAPGLRTPRIPLRAGFLGGAAQASPPKRSIWKDFSLKINFKTSSNVLINIGRPNNYRTYALFYYMPIRSVGLKAYATHIAESVCVSPKLSSGKASFH